MASDTEITKVRIVIRHLLWQIREVRKDKDAAWRWVNSFANTLQYQDLEQDPDQYALAILAEARSFNDQKKRNQQMRWVRDALTKEGVKNPTQEQLDEKWLEMYGVETVPEDAESGDAYDDCKAPPSSGRNSEVTGQGRTGGGPVRGGQRIEPPARSLTLPTTEQLYDFARAENLDEADARDWYEMTVVERAGKDRYGKPIGNWKVTCRRFCEAKAKKRSTLK